MGKMDITLQWMEERKGKVTYSMTNRLGPASYDCSSAVYFALLIGGFLPANTRIGNTDSLFSDLEKHGWAQLNPNPNGNYEVKRGDIFIWGTRGGSGGAAGHTGIFIDEKAQIIHCNYGRNGISVNNHDSDWQASGRPRLTIYRVKANAPEYKPIRRFGYRVDDLKQYNKLWQIRNNHLCPVDFEWKYNGVLPEDVDKIYPNNGSLHPNQILRVGDYFSFRPECVLSADTPTIIKGHKFMRIRLKNSGFIWLKTNGVEQLIYG